MTHSDSATQEHETLNDDAVRALVILNANHDALYTLSVYPTDGEEFITVSMRSVKFNEISTKLLAAITPS